MNRVTEIGLFGSDVGAQYAYTGTGRRISMSMAAGLLIQSVAAAGVPGYPGLDRFGRLTDLHYTLGGETVQRYQYGYDRAGNRVHARVTQSDWEGESRDNVRSWRYAYDGLQRLIGAEHGRLNPGNTAMEPMIGTLGTTWHLDNLGNWSGASDNHSVVTAIDTDGDGTLDASTFIHHTVNSANELLAVVSNGNAAAMLADSAGNLTSDGDEAGDRIYQYDGLNRLVQVNQRGDNVSMEADGRIREGQLGPLVYRLVYDGLGRVIRKELPESPSSPQLRIEDYYYDGVRRIQDVVRSPQAVPPPPPCAVEPLTKEGSEGEWKNEEGESKGSELPPCEKGDPEETVTTPSYEVWTDREYIYGPGDVNEFILQLDANDRPLYMLQDANLNVVGLIGMDPVDGIPPSAGGLPPGAPADGGPVVIRQDVYSPYGEVVATDLFDPAAADNKVGFQGMFADAFITKAAASQLAPGIQVAYRTPNRSYSPTLGRWLQRDPNATGQTIVGVAPFNGLSFTNGLEKYALPATWRDGANPFLFAKGRPNGGRDPLGLSADMDWDAETERIVDELEGHQLYVIGTLNEGAKAASLGMGVALDLLEGFLPGSSWVDAYKAIGALYSGEGGFWEVLDIVSVALPVVGAIGSMRAIAKSRSFRLRTACNCFVAGTMVATPDGPRPIELLGPGDVVFTRSERSAEESLTQGAVTQKFVARKERIVEIILSNGARINATPEHPIWVVDRGWVNAGDLIPSDSLLGLNGDTVTVLGTCTDSIAAVVYNIEVHNTATYFADGVWVHNQSCMHHIATNKSRISRANGGPWTPVFEEMFDKAGMKLDDPLNLIELDRHSGPHSQLYHQEIFNRLFDATQGLKDDAYGYALRHELAKIRAELKSVGSYLNELLEGN